MNSLPTNTVLLNSRGELLPKGYQNERLVQSTGKRYILATCHYKVEANGEHSYDTTFRNIRRMMFMTPKVDNNRTDYAISRIVEYGVDTTYSADNLTGKWKLENEPVPVETIEASDIPFSERAER